MGSNACLVHVNHKCTCTILLSGEDQQTELDQDESLSNVLVLLKGGLRTNEAKN